MMCCFADVNECESNNGGCAQMCTNTIGSFECSCSVEGYVLAANNASCEGKSLNHFSQLTVHQLTLSAHAHEGYSL